MTDTRESGFPGVIWRNGLTATNVTSDTSKRLKKRVFMNVRQVVGGELAVGTRLPAPSRHGLDSKPAR